MASLALSGVWQPRTLTDRRKDITTIKSQPNSAGLTVADTVGDNAGTIGLIVECGKEVRYVRFAVPTLSGRPWLLPTISRAARLLALPPDWDMQGAVPIDAISIQTAIDALILIMSHDSSLPQWTPTHRSGVQLDWHENGIDLEIAFEPDETGGYAVLGDRRHPEVDWSGPLGEHLEPLRRLFQERLVS